ncbi:MAG: hypothetical protein QXP22_00965 [Candidatus Anstonellales archaeon]
MALFEFLNSIMEKIQKAKPLSKDEIALIKDSIKNGYVNGAIFAKAILHAYSNLALHKKPEGKEAYLKLQAITSSALNRALEGKEPFSEYDKTNLIDVFEKLGFEGNKVAISYMTNFNIVFGMALNEQLDKLKEKEKEQEVLTPTLTATLKKEEKTEEKKKEEKLTG